MTHVNMVNLLSWPDSFPTFSLEDAVTENEGVRPEVSLFLVFLAFYCLCLPKENKPTKQNHQQKPNN